MVTVKVNKETCIGCGNCTNVCDNFKLVDQKAQVINPNPKEVGCNEEAKKECPVDAISITS